ncbi:chaplin [Streptomyces qinzhouensis]|uniref:Chaplin n=1 Tax=Streptomyces qinzhouensis TaxID=2599401 RepID=A0A5B8J6F8_9ACTN|nr:chaplin [Streptomyces qinzhouensis]QDY76014.1 chaplin [Streptomyces qinzhouensis]
MRQVTRKGLITMAAAAGGALALGGGYAQADSGAHGAAVNSPGVGSGNTVQVPVNVPVNACGNTVDVVGLLNPAFGNNCANTSSPAKAGPAKPAHAPAGPGSGTGVPAGNPPAGTNSGTNPGTNSGTNGGTITTGGGAHAGGGTANSPGVGSGNTIQAPVDVPVNACGNTIDIISLLNPAFGNTCVNDSSIAQPLPPEHPVKPVQPVEPPTAVKPVDREPTAPVSRSVERPAQDDDILAHTGAGSLGLIAPAGAGLLLAGAVLYRRSRASA